MTFIYVGAEAEISLEMALCDHFQGKLYHQEIDLVEALPLLCLKDAYEILLDCSWWKGEMLVLVDLLRLPSQLLRSFPSSFAGSCSF